jgi:hypothetical protein
MIEANNEKTVKKATPLWQRLLFVVFIVVFAMSVFQSFSSFFLRLKFGRQIKKVYNSSQPLTFQALNSNYTASEPIEDAGDYYSEAISNLVMEDSESIVKINTYYRQVLFGGPTKLVPEKLNEGVRNDIARLRPVFNLIDEAASLDISNFDLRIESGMDACRQQLKILRSTFYLMSLRTLHLTYLNKHNDAASSITSSLKMLRTFEFQPVIISSEIKYGILRLLCDDIRILLKEGTVSNEKLAQLADALSTAMGENSLHRTLLAERIYQLHTVRDFLPPKVYTDLLGTEFLTLQGKVTLPETKEEESKILSNLIAYFDIIEAAIQASAKPWPEPLNNAKQYSKSESKILQNLSNLIKLVAETTAVVNITAANVAANSYIQRHGDTPASLEELQGNFLASTPIDPYTGSPLIYKAEKDRYTIYSTGPNQRDDNGQIRTMSKDEKPLDMGISVNLQN